MSLTIFRLSQISVDPLLPLGIPPTAVRLILLHLASRRTVGAHHGTGSCWNLTYMGETITVTVVDYAGDGFNIAEEAMNTLTCADSKLLSPLQIDC